ncbi:cell wall protein Iff4p [[Candida] anglica]|uniref:Cell wall protein Iff4p n=1 Tax=[Candida] anglica TaxID=148631 RepID=A0ABP0EAV0_9ASCO
MRFGPKLKLVATAALALTPVLGQHITSDRTDHSSVLMLGDVVVDAGATWRIYNALVETFFGKIIIKGRFFVNIDRYPFSLSLTSATLKEFNNSGVICLDSIRSGVAPIYSFVVGTFHNTGEIYFSAAGNVLQSIYIIAAPNWTNAKSGSIHLYQDKRANGYALLGRIGRTIVNDGQICIRNHAWLSNTPIKGSGCIEVGMNSNFWYFNSLIDFDAEQTVYLSHSSSSFKVESLGRAQTYKVAGFGNNNVIGLTVSITKFHYDEKTGIMNLMTGLPPLYFNQYFKIGTGYDPKKFVVQTVDFGGFLGKSIYNAGVRYYGPIPEGSTPHTGCVVCKDIPPMVDPTSSILSSGTIESTSSGMIFSSATSSGMQFSSVESTSSSADASSSDKTSPPDTSSNVGPSNSSPTSGFEPTSNSEITSDTPVSSTGPSDDCPITSIPVTACVSTTIPTFICQSSDVQSSVPVVSSITTTICTTTLIPSTSCSTETYTPTPLCPTDQFTRKLRSSKSPAAQFNLKDVKLISDHTYSVTLGMKSDQGFDKEHLEELNIDCGGVKHTLYDVSKNIDLVPNPKDWTFNFEAKCVDYGDKICLPSLSVSVQWCVFNAHSTLCNSWFFSYDYKYDFGCDANKDWSIYCWPKPVKSVCETTTYFTSSCETTVMPTTTWTTTDIPDNSCETSYIVTSTCETTYIPTTQCPSSSSSSVASSSSLTSSNDRSTDSSSMEPSSSYASSSTTSPNSNSSASSDSIPTNSASSSTSSSTNPSNSDSSSESSTSSDTTSRSVSSSASSSINPSNTASSSGSIHPSNSTTSGTSSDTNSGATSGTSSGSLGPSDSASGSVNSSASGSASHSVNPSGSTSGSASGSDSRSVNPSESGSDSTSGSASGSISGSASGSVNPSDSASGSASESASGSVNPSDSTSASASGSVNPSDSASGSTSASASGSINPNSSASGSASGSVKPSDSAYDSTSGSASGSINPSSSASGSASGSVNPSDSASGSTSESASGSVNPSNTASGSTSGSASGSVNPSSSAYDSTSASASGSINPSSSASGSASGSVNPSNSTSGSTSESASGSVNPSSAASDSSSGSVNPSDPSSASVSPSDSFSTESRSSSVTSTDATSNSDILSSSISSTVDPFMSSSISVSSSDYSSESVSSSLSSSSMSSSSSTSDYPCGPTANPTACSPSSVGTPGLGAVFYPYTYGDDDTSKSLGFMTGGYKKLTSLASIPHISNLQLSENSRSVAKSFLVELTGYFKAPAGGSYDFELSVKDAAVVLVGAGSAFSCCNTNCIGNRDAMFAHWDEQKQLLGKDSRTISFGGGVYYPIKIVYSNKGGPISLSLTANGPTGTISIMDHVFSFDNEPDGCPATGNVRRNFSASFDSMN